MFSIMTMVPSMRIPKSIAPIESRFAETSWAWRKMKENSKERGMVSATMTAARRLTRKKTSTTNTRAMPRRRLASTVSVVRRTSSLRS